MQVASNRKDRKSIVDHLLDLLACFSKSSRMRNNTYWLKRRMRKNGLPPIVSYNWSEQESSENALFACVLLVLSAGCVGG